MIDRSNYNFGGTVFVPETNHKEDMLPAKNTLRIFDIHKKNPQETTLFTQ
jgi:hypothetical protein